MADTPTSQVWIGRAIFIGVICAIIFAQLLPLDTRPVRWAPPDFMLAATLAWVARRPDFAPFFVITILFLLADLLFQRPPGLWAALVLILTEVIRSRALYIRNIPVLLEWASVALGIVVLTVANRIVLAVAMTPQAPLGMTLIQMIATILSYPVVVLVVRFVFRISRPAPGQVDSYGHRL